MADSQVKVELTIEERQALQALARMSRQIEELEKSAGDAGEALDDSMNKGASAANNLGGSLTKSVFLGNLAAEAFSVVAGAVKDFVFGSVAAAQEQEDAINRLRQAVRAAGGDAEASIPSFIDYASQLQQTSIYGDEVVISQLALAKSLGATDQQAKDLVQAAANLSATFGGDLGTNVEKLGKALNGNLGKLGQYVPELKGLTKEQLAAGAATDLINSKFGGAAAAQLDTYSGKVTAMKNALSDLQEELGANVTESGFIQDAVSALAGVFQIATQTLADFRTEQKRANGTLVENANTLDQLKRKYQDLQVELIDYEQTIIRAADPKNMVNVGDLGIAKVKVKSLTAELEGLKAQISAVDSQVAATNANAARNPSSNRASGETKSAEDVKKQIEAEKVAIAELQAAKDANRLYEQEQEIIGREVTAANREQELADLVAFEQAKIDAQFAVQEQRNALIEDGRLRELAQQKTFQDKALASAKSSVEAKKSIDARQVSLEQQKQAAIAGIVGSGFALLGALAKDGSKEQFLIQKAAAIAEIAIARGKALSLIPAQTATIPYPANLAAAAQMTAYVNAQSALGLATVVAQTIKGFKDGGIVPGNSTSGDKVLARVNSGEMILNQNQQANLFDQINSGNGGGGENIQQLISAMKSQPIVVEIDGREIARVVRDQRNGGFQV